MAACASCESCDLLRRDLEEKDVLLEKAKKITGDLKKIVEDLNEHRHKLSAKNKSFKEKLEEAQSQNRRKDEQIRCKDERAATLQELLRGARLTEIG